MGKLFGTNGVRGVFSEDFTLEFVHDLVLAISTYFKEFQGGYNTCWI